MNEDMNQQILICKLYTGGFLSEVSNIGHEAINQFKAANGEDMSIFLQEEKSLATEMLNMLSL